MTTMNKNDIRRECGNATETAIVLSNYSWFTATWTWTVTSYTGEVCEVPTIKAAWHYAYSEARAAEREGREDIHIVLDIR